jgi:hypothetical protein
VDAGGERVLVAPERSAESGLPLRVFLCHSSEDKPIVRELHRRLRDDGVEPWLDEEEILPGQDWQREITNALRTTHAVLVCVSSRSMSKAGYLQREIKEVLSIADEQPPGTIFVIPVRLEDCPVPERFRSLQWVNFFEEAGYVRLRRSLVGRGKALGRLSI